MKKSTHHETAQLVIALLVVVLAAGVFFLFYSYLDFIMLSGNLPLFMVLTTIVFGLLITLVYLTFNSKAHHKKEAKKVSKTTKAKAATKKKKK